VFSISVRIPKVVRFIGVRSSGMWICGAGVLELWRPEMRQGWYSRYEAATGNVAGATVNHESESTFAGQTSTCISERRSDVSFGGFAHAHVHNISTTHSELVRFADTWVR